MVKRVTIKDVAARAGVSYQTVSRVINDKGEVSPETRARIQATIEELGYRPDAIARSMVNGRTHTLACLAPNLTDYTFACIIENAKAEAQKHGYFLIATSTEQENEVSALCDDMLYSRRADGLMVLNPYADGRHRYFEKLIARGVAVVYLGDHPRRAGISSVRLDNESGGYQATQHLITLGHKRIATIIGPQNEDCVQGRITGYKRALKEASLRAPTDLMVAGDWSASSGYQAMKQLLTSGLSFSALFAQNDRMAVGAMQAAREHGLRVPEQLGVVGFDDMPLASYFDPPLTTIRQDIVEHGRQAARLLINRVEKPEVPVEHVVIMCDLIVRRSCGAKLG
jgi:LacI family transcriptional regulator